jgi:hypothetical protein
MKLSLHSLCLAAVSLVAVSAANAGPVTQSTSPANFDSYWYGNGWATADLGSVTLAQGTNSIISLTGVATLVDQGWGGQDGDNGLKIWLEDNGTPILGLYAAGATHNWTTSSFDLSADITALDSALAGINWVSNPDITLDLVATPWAYPGWELHVRDASFTVTSSSSVPDAASTAALLGLGLVAIVGAGRKFGFAAQS